MAEILSIQAEERAPGKKSFARELRRKGMVPGIIYGRHISSLPISFSTKEIEKILHQHGVSLIEIQVSNKKYPSILKDVQRHVLKGNIIHVDFQNVNMDEEVTTTVNVELKGASPGIKLGGILDFTLKELDIKCLPASIPESIVIDISLLNINDSVRIKDLKISGDIKFLQDEDETIVSIVPPMAEEELETTAEPEGEPEVIGKGKEKEEGEEEEKGETVSDKDKPSKDKEEK